MEDTLSSFDNRQKAVRRKHTRMAKGYVTKLNRHGVFIQQPDNKSKSFVLRKMVLLSVGLFAFKSLVLISLGTEVYQSKVDALGTGTSLEKAGAYVMQIDPVTAQIATLITPWVS